MKVVSKLADVDFLIGTVDREGDTLVIENDPAQPMRSKVYVSADDVVRLLVRMLCRPAALLWVLALPYYYLRGARAASKPQPPPDPWGSQ